MRVWKYPLERPVQAIDLPVMARIVACEIQNEVPTLWAIVNPTGPTQKRVFQAFATGEGVPPLAEYVGTVFAVGNQLVWHIFEVTHVDPR